MKRLVMCTSTGCLEYAPERYRNLGIDIIRIHLFFKGKEYLEGFDLDPVDLYKQMENAKEVKDNLPHTAMPTYEEIAGHFQKAIDEGYDEIICIAISSGLGGTYNFRNADLHVGDEKMAFLRLFGKKSTISKQFFVIQNKLHDIIYHFR